MGILIKIEQRHRDARSPKPTPTENLGVVAQIGRCVGCQHRAQLTDGACPLCRMRFGPKCGHIMERIRTDAEYARICYLSLDAENRKRAFISMFGLPPGCRAS